MTAIETPSAHPPATRRPHRSRVGQASAALSALLSAVLGVAAAVDQLGPRELADHARDLYAPHGVDPSPSVLYGLLYAVSVIGLVGWLLAWRAARARRWWWGPVASAAAGGTTLVLVAALLLASEYGERLFPAVWGLLAALPLVTGAVAVVVPTLSVAGRPRGSGPR